MWSLRKVVSRWSALLWEPSIGLIVILAMGIRLVLIPWFSEPFNFWAGYLSSQVLVGGHDPFSLFAVEPRFQQLGPWPYPAEYFLFAVGAFLGSGGSPSLYPIWVRIPNVLADAGTAILLFRIARTLGWEEGRARIAAAVFALNPFTILVSAIWGTNDPIPVLFSVLALYFFLRNREGDAVLGAFSLGLGIATKLYPVLFLPMVLAGARGWSGKLRIVAVATVVPLMTSAPFLLANARPYLGIAFGFAGGTSGLNRNQLDPQFTVWRVADWFVGPLDARLAFVAAAGLAVGILVLYRMIQRGDLDMTRGFAIGVPLAYLLAVRWSANYFVWAVPFVVLVATRSLSGWRRWLVLGFWVPALAYTLIYNGWYPDPYSGGSGLTYWMFVSGFEGIRIFEFFPPAVAPALTLASVLTIAAVVLILFQPSPRDRTRAPSPDRSNEAHRPGRPAWARVPHRLAAILTVAFLATFAVSLTFQLANERPVDPADFADFSILPDGTFSLTDDFHADILSFRWVFEGDGRYILHPNGASGIFIDTIRPNGTAFIRNAFAAERLSSEIRFRWNVFYGVEPLVVLRADRSRLDLLPAGGTGARLRFVDERTNQTSDLGPIGPGWTTLRYTASPQEQRVEAGGSEFVFPPNGPFTSIDVGHAEPYPDGGGQLEIGSVNLRWNGDLEAIRPISPGLVVGLDVLALAGLVLLPSIRKRLPIRGLNRNREQDRA